jgi:ribonuclease HII
MKKEKKANSVVVGIDEAGRGPLAGPVAVGACLYDESDLVLRRALSRLFPAIQDSKQLSERKREAAYRELVSLSKTTTLRFRVALVSSVEIDRKGISWAIRKGVRRVLRGLAPHPSRAKVLLDGGLHAPALYARQETHIRGDARFLPVALASIVAKVTRDRHMIRLAERFPAYGFELHKGYGTMRHFEALERWGVTDAHRQSFLGAGKTGSRASLR